MICEEDVLRECIIHLAQPDVLFETPTRVVGTSSVGYNDTALFYDEEQEEYAGCVTILPYDELKEFKINQEETE